MPDTTTILKEAAKLWWDSLYSNSQRAALTKKYSLNIYPTDDNIIAMYNLEHPTTPVQELEKMKEDSEDLQALVNGEMQEQEFEKDIQQRKKLYKEEVPLEIKKKFIEAAKGYASHSQIGVTINNPNLYKAFRDGQDAAFDILKSDFPSDSIQSMNEEYLKLKAHIKILRETLVGTTRDLYIKVGDSKQVIISREVLDATK